MASPYAFTLRSDEKKMVVKTVSLTSVDGTPSPPSGYEYIPFKIANPGAADLNAPVDLLGSSLYTVSPLTNQYTVSTDSYGNQRATMDYLGRLFINVEANKYKNISAITGGCNPISSSFPLISLDDFTLTSLQTGLQCAYHFTGTVDPVFDWVPGPLGVVIPEVLSWTTDPAFPGQYILTMNLVMSGSGGYGSDYDQLNCGQLWARFNEPSIEGHAIAPSSQPGTFNDPVATNPAAYFQMTQNYPMPTSWQDTRFVCTFYNGASPADFPEGQRLRQMYSVPRTSYAQPSTALNPSTGLLCLTFGSLYDAFGSFATRANSYPWSLTKITDGDGELQWADGTIGQYIQWLEFDPTAYIANGVLTMELA